jgi:RNA polymerase sigma factor (sigma-70 family)
MPKASRESYTKYKTTQLDNDLLVSLLERSRAGDAAAQQELWGRGAGYAMGVISKMVHDGHLRSDAFADGDLVQEAMLAVGGVIERWQPERGAFSTFAYHRIRGAVLSYLGGETRHAAAIAEPTPLVDDDEDGIEFEPETAHGGQDEPQYLTVLLAEILGQVEKLPYTQRLAIMHYYGLRGYTPKTLREVADILGDAHPTTAKRLIDKGLATLREGVLK